MSYEYGPPTDRWNVNLPAVVGVVFVFLVAIIVWVITSSGSDDEPGASADPTVAPAVEATPAPTSPPATTTPAPMPDLTAVPGTSTPTSTAPDVTAAPGADPDAVPGDLAIDGRPMLAPLCNDSFITVIASAVGDQASAPAIASVLDQYPAANYLRTDQTCPSLTQDIDGAPIYVVYFGPFPFASDACAARADGTPDAYARQLSDTLGPGHSVNCDGG